MEKPRTLSQSRALHLAFQQISTELVGQGIDQRTVIRDLKGYSAPVTAEFLKMVFKTIAWTMYRKDSTTQLTTAELTGCFDVLTKFLGETYGVSITFPSYDALAFETLGEDGKM